MLPPPSPRSSEDSLRIRAQLRPTFARRRTADYRNRNSCEKPAHRRKAPTPTRFGFAGAGASAKPSPPTSPRSTEDSLRSRTQLRPTFARRSRADYRKPNSCEKPAHRRKAPAPTKVVFAGAGANVKHSPPPSHRSTEDSLRSRTQLRPTFSRRRRADYRNPNSCEKPAHRRKAPAPIRLAFAGAGAHHGDVNSDEGPLPGEERATQPLAPASIRPQEESRLPEPHLRREGRSPEESTSSDQDCLRWRTPKPAIRLNPTIGSNYYFDPIVGL